MASSPLTRSSADEKISGGFSEQDKKRLTDEITKAVNDDVFPAYRKFAEFLRTEYDPKGRTELSIESLADGKRRYAEAVKTMTTVNVPPAKVHEIGLKEVERITAEMTKLAQSRIQGPGQLPGRGQQRSQWKPTSEQQILDDYKKYIHQMEPKLPELFGLLPKSPVTVEPIPILPKPPRLITSRARRMENVRAASLLRSLIPPSARWSTMKPLPITKAFPVITCKSVSPRRWKVCRSFGCTVFFPRMPKVGRSIRGIGKEIGFYQDPVSDYGRLNSECFAPSGWWSIPGFTTKIGAASR